MRENKTTVESVPLRKNNEQVRRTRYQPTERGRESLKFIIMKLQTLQVR